VFSSPFYSQSTLLLSLQVASLSSQQIYFPFVQFKNLIFGDPHQENLLNPENINLQADNSISDNALSSLIFLLMSPLGCFLLDLL
jgi:hypothetical protein